MKTKENNTLQFCAGKEEKENLFTYSMVECSSYYFSKQTRRIFNSKIKRILLVDTNEEYKGTNSNILSRYGYNPYKVENLITVVLEEVEHFYDNVKEYKIIVLHNNKMLFNIEQDNFTDYKKAKEELNRLEEELKTSLDCLKEFV